MTWATVQEGIRVAIRAASGLPDSAVAWTITPGANSWVQYPRVRITPLRSGEVGIPFERYSWDNNAGIMRHTVEGVSVLRVQVKIETDRGSQGLGAPFAISERFRRVLQTTQVRDTLRGLGVAVHTITDFTPFDDSIENRDLVVFINEVLFQVNNSVDITPLPNGEDWFNQVQVTSNTQT